MAPPDAPFADALVGRDAELAALREIVEADRPGASVVLVAGEAGIGKSRLLQELSATLAPGWAVVHGRAWDEIECPPYWPWTSALRALVGADASDLSGVVLDGVATGDRFELFDATAALLRQEAEARPVVVVLDDLHAADPPTLLLTQYLARELTDRRVTIVGAHRPVDPERRPEVHRHLDALAQTGVTVPLRGLDVAAVAELLGDGALADEVHDLTGGNPLFVAEIRRRFAPQSSRAPRSSERTPVGDTMPAVGGVAAADVLRGAIGERVGRLAPELRRTLAAVAVLAGTATVADVARLLPDSGTDDVVAQLEALVDDGLARLGVDDPIGERTASVHSLVGEVALGGLPVADVRGLHLAAARLLEGDPRRSGERAQHLLRAGPEHLDDAIVASLAAADAAAAATAHEDAANHCERALGALDEQLRSAPALADDAPHLRRRTDAWLRLGRARRLADRGAAADAAFDAAAELAGRAGDDRRLALAALRGGIQYFTRHDRDPELAGRIEDALARLPEVDDPLRARLLADLAARTGDPGRATARAHAAVAMARRTGDPVALGTALIAEQVTDLGPATLTRRTSSAREVLALARRADDPTLAVHGRFLLFGALLEHGDLRGIAAELGALGDVDDALVGSTIARSELWTSFTRALFAGDTERAEAVAAQALDLAHRVGDPWGYRIYGGQVGPICWIRDRWSEIEGLYTAQRQEHPDEPVWSAVLAWICAHDGRTADAADALADVGPLDRLPHGIHQLITMTMAAEATAVVGDAAAVAAAREQLLPYVDRFVPINVGAAAWGPVARASAALANRLGLADESVAHLERAIAVCDRLDARPWRAEARLLLAERLAELGRADDPRMPVLAADARAEAVALGIERFIDRAEALAVDAAPIRPVPVPEPEDRRPRVAVLGTFEVTSAAGEVARWNSRKARELLKFLVAKRGAPVHREVVMDLLWPDVAPDRLANRYAVVLNTIRRALDPERERPASALVATDRDTVRLRLEEVEVDVEVFLDRANGALARDGGAGPDAAAALVAAAELYAGPVLPDEPYAEWARPLRDEVRLVHLKLVRSLADRAVAAGDHLAAADAFRQLVEADPLDPEVHSGLADALARLGASAAADAERARFAEVARHGTDRSA